MSRPAPHTLVETIDPRRDRESGEGVRQPQRLARGLRLVEGGRDLPGTPAVTSVSASLGKTVALQAPAARKGKTSR